MKEKLLFYIHNFYLADYLFFFAIFILFIMVVGIVLWIRSSGVWSLVMLFFSLIMVGCISVVGYIALDKQIRPKNVTILANQKLQYSNNVFVHFTIEPEYKKCLINIKLIKQTNDPIQNLKNHIHPLAKISFVVKNQTNIQKIIPNIKSKDYNLLLSANCF